MPRPTPPELPPTPGSLRLSPEVLLESIADGISVLARDGTILQVNRVMESWHAEATPLVGKRCYEAYHGRKAPCETCPVRRVWETGAAQSQTQSRCDAEGRPLAWRELFAFPLRDPESAKIQAVVEYVRDITARRRAESAAREARETLEQRVAERTAALREANRQLRDAERFQAVLALIRGLPADGSDEELWGRCLEALVETYGFRMAWFGRLSEGVLRPLAWRGRADGYLDGLTLTIRPPATPDSGCAMSQAVLRRVPFGYADLAHDEGFRPWRDEAVKRGYRSNLALPVVVDGKVEGGAMVYAGEPRAFGGERTEQLWQLVSEVGHLLAQRRRETAARRSLQESELQFRTVVESAHDGICLLHGGTLVYANRQAAALVGREPHELLNRPYLDFVHADDRERVADIYESFRQRPQALEDFETGLLHRDGRRVEVEVGASVISHRGASAVVVFLHDITARKQAEAALVRSERLAAVGTLAGGVAHEFNNINVAILGFLQLALERDDLDAELRDWLVRVQRAARRGGEITRNLLAFARPQETPAGGGDLNRLIEDTLQLVRREFHTDGVEIVFRPDPLPAVAMHPAWIGQVILNFLINARHALIDRPRRRIVITTGQEEERIYARFADTGCGIPAAQREHIFMPFYSTKGEHAPAASRQARVRGTGLGLSISHTIVAEHGGSIDVQSTEGEGSVFTLWLPARPPSEAAAPAAAAESPALRGRRILVLDDEADTRDLLQLLLERHGCRVETTADGHQALARLRESACDLVMVDLQMPIQSGRDFLRALQRERLPRRPTVVVITGKADGLSEREARDLGVTRILLKPFALNEITPCLDAALAAE
jgi:PAS domain S-box-containing protein